MTSEIEICPSLSVSRCHSRVLDCLEKVSASIESWKNSAKSFLKEKEKKVEEPKVPWGVGTCLDNLGKFIANIVENNKGQVIPNILVLSDGKEVPNIIIDKDGKLFDLKI